MAKWSATNIGWTPVAVADATNFTSAGFHALQGGSSTQQLQVNEVYMGGLASASSPAQMIFARDSTIGVTLSGTTNAALDPATAALAAPMVSFNTATTKPQRSTTLQILQLSFNAFGGVVRWAAIDPSETIRMLGNTASFGELSLSSGSAGTPGLMSDHFIYEPL